MLQSSFVVVVQTIHSTLVDFLLRCWKFDKIDQDHSALQRASMCLQMAEPAKSDKKYQFKAGYYHIVGGVSMEKDDDVWIFCALFTSTGVGSQLLHLEPHFQDDQGVWLFFFFFPCVCQCALADFISVLVGFSQQSGSECFHFCFRCSVFVKSWYRISAQNGFVSGGKIVRVGRRVFCFHKTCKIFANLNHAHFFFSLGRARL